MSNYLGTNTINVLWDIHTLQNFESSNFQDLNIFEIFEIFEVQSEANQILKFKVWICSNQIFLIFDLNRTFRISKLSDLNIFKLWILVFDLLRFELRISRISRIYSDLENCLIQSFAKCVYLIAHLLYLSQNNLTTIHLLCFKLSDKNHIWLTLEFMQRLSLSANSS